MKRGTRRGKGRAQAEVDGDVRGDRKMDLGRAFEQAENATRLRKPI